MNSPSSSSEIDQAVISNTYLLRHDIIIVFVIIIIINIRIITYFGDN